MYIDAKERLNVFTHYKVSKVVDGDGIYCYNIFNKKEIEIRLLGIDAPEIKRCRKLKQDERELHLPGQLLIQLGYQSKNYLHELLPIGTDITFITEVKNPSKCFNSASIFAISSSLLTKFPSGTKNSVVPTMKDDPDISSLLAE